MSSNAGGPLRVGVDLGGTKILAAVINAEHQILGRAKRATPAREGGPAILAEMVAAVREAIAEGGATLDDVSCLGVGSPGPLDPDTGVIHRSANLNVQEFPLGPELTAALGKPVLLQNDVRVGGYGEFRLGAGRGCRDVIAVFVGTGIGGCVVQGGAVVEGKTRNAGEVGHMTIKAGGPKCGCGNRGCLEALASRTAMVRRITKAIREGHPTVLKPRHPGKAAKKDEAPQFKSKDIAAAVALNDTLVKNEVDRAAHYLGLALGSLINLLGPERIIVGGGIATALGARYLDRIRASARQQAVVDTRSLVEIVSGDLGDDAGVLGAALLAAERFPA